jgi:hypothetical protein
MKMRPSGSDLLAEMSLDPSQIGRIPIPPMVWRSIPRSILSSPSNASTQQLDYRSPSQIPTSSTFTPTNEAVAKINDDLLGQLLGEVLTFHGDDSGNLDDLGHEEMTGEEMVTMNWGGLPFLFSVSRLVLR